MASILEIILNFVRQGSGVEEATQGLEELSQAQETAGDSSEQFSQAEDQVTQSSKEAEEAQKKLEQQAHAVGDAFGVATTQVALLGGAVNFLKGFFSESISAARESATAEAELATAIKNSGGAAGVTQEQLEKLAGEIQDHSNFTDEAVEHTQSLLLTYQNVGGTVFPRATQAIADMAQAMGGNLNGAAQLAGRALDAPAEASSRLERAGIRLTDQQQDQINAMVKLGDVAGAQGIVLDAIESRYGGQAQAARDAAGSTQDLAVAYGNLQEEFGGLLTKLQDAGAADGAVSFLDKVTSGASAWQGVIDKMNLLAEAQMKVDGTSDETAAALERYKQANITAANAPLEGALTRLIGWWYESGTASDEMVQAVQDVATATGNTTPPYMYAQAIEQIATASDDATEAQENLAQRAAALANSYGGQNDAFGQKQDLAKIQAADDMSKASRDKQAKDAADLANEQEREGKRAASAMEKAFKSSADNIGSAIADAIKPSLAEVWKPPEGSAEHVDEAARRLATVATSGFSSDFLQQLGTQFSGQAFWKPIAAAAASGDEGALKAAATQTLVQFQQGLIPQLYNVDLIKAQVRQQLQQQRIKEQMIETVKKELGASGIAKSIGVVNIAAGDVATAQATVASGATDMATATKDSGADLAKAYDPALSKLNTMEITLRRIIGLTDTWASKTKAGVETFYNVGAGAAVMPTDAQKKLGGVSGL